MTSPAKTFGEAVVEAAKAIAAAEDSNASSKAAVEKKEAEIKGLEEERVELAKTQTQNSDAYKKGVKDLKAVVDAEDARLNPPAPGA